MHTALTKYTAKERREAAATARASGKRLDLYVRDLARLAGPMGLVAMARAIEAAERRTA